MSDNWQNKIFNHEETPPKGAWENIARMLDEADKKEKTTTPAVNKNTKIIYWRIAAAACIIAALVTTVVWLNSGTINTQPTVANTIIPKISEEKISTTINNQPAVEIVKNSKASSKALPTNNQKTASTFNNISANIDTKIEYVKADPIESLTGKPTLNKAEKLTNTSGEVTNDIALMNAPNNYVSFIGPNGQEVKVSSKFSNLLGYMDGKDPEDEEYLDKIINESNFWRGKFKAWRNKMINNSIAPTPANFMDIIELSKLLQEDK